MIPSTWRGPAQRRGKAAIGLWTRTSGRMSGRMNGYDARPASSPARAPPCVTPGRVLLGRRSRVAAVAQPVEQRIRNAWVGGSNPFRGTASMLSGPETRP